MPCYHPLGGYLAKSVNPTGKRSIVFNLQEGFKDKSVQLPCGRCIGCRLERARQWSVRCMHEASLYDSNVFVTLTYSDDGLPSDGSLKKRDIQLFMKRLRKLKGAGIRYFLCGEYGEKSLRPHYHALLFNCDFGDKYLVRNPLGTRNVYNSKELTDLWGFGLTEIGTVTAASAGYVARYNMKKVYGEAAKDWYMGREPEFLLMSRKPGIGAEWYRKFWKDVFPSDELVVNGVVTKPPRFYSDRFASAKPKAWRSIVRRRMKAALASPDNTGKRLVVREVVKEASVKSLARSL